jgi:UDP-GlcNAc:undecaprenyl-phosphate/decaprenyl-phosphate GlcNAc-1-phosphate transferase
LMALLWIPFLMNALNWSSGVDGQASGVVAIAAGVIGLLSLNYSADISQWPVAIIGFSLCGAFVALSLFSFYPQRIMPGYSAMTLAGFLLAVTSILSTAKLGTLLVVLGLPIVDGVYAMARRAATGKPLMKGDRGHLHHKLLEIGWGKRRIALFYWLLTLILGVLALSINAKMKVFAIVGLALVVGLLFLWVYYWGSYEPQDQGSGSKT